MELMADRTETNDASSPRRGPLWLRLLVGPDVAGRRDVQKLPASSVLSLLWWRLGLTPTARFRANRFRESILDDRGPSFSVRVARQSAPPNR